MTSSPSTHLILHATPYATSPTGLPSAASPSRHDIGDRSRGLTQSGSGPGAGLHPALGDPGGLVY
jgi:hypothetical protein